MLTRHEKHHDEHGEALHFLWVLGEAGACSTWLSPGTLAIIGYSVSDGVVFHSPVDVGDADSRHAGCPFLEGADCFIYRGPSLMTWLPVGHHPVIEAYDAGDTEPLFGVLEAFYKEMTQP